MKKAAFYLKQAHACAGVLALMLAALLVGVIVRNDRASWQTLCGYICGVGLCFLWCYCQTWAAVANVMEERAKQPTVRLPVCCVCLRKLDNLFLLDSRGRSYCCAECKKKGGGYEP